MSRPEDKQNVCWKSIAILTIPLHMRVYMWEMIGIGIIGGMFSTYSAFMAIFGADSITKPCYWPD